MNPANELNTNALREHRQLERDTLEAVQREAMTLERMPEGQEKRSEATIIDGHEIKPAKARIGGRLSVRW